VAQLHEVCDRDTIPRERSIDVRFDDFMTDELAVVERVYAQAGEDLDEAARSAIADYLGGHQRGRHGTVATSSEMFGLSARDLREPSAPFFARFLT
jgi:hypothetical protein